MTRGGGYSVVGTGLRAGYRFWAAGYLVPSTEYRPPATEYRQPSTGHRQRGFTLLELLIAIFVLAVAMGGALGAVYAAGRRSSFARQRTVAADLVATAMSDVLYAAESAREMHGGVLSFGDTPFNSSPYEQKTDDALGPGGCQRKGYRMRAGSTDYTYGWLWRAHSWDAATGLYSVDVWVFRNPDEPSVTWGCAPDSPSKHEQTLFYLRTKVETRGP